MSKAIVKLQAAQQRAMAVRPKVGGFPYLAETLRRAGVTRNLWFLPAGQSLYLTQDGPVVNQGTPLLSGTADVPPFNRQALHRGVAHRQGRQKHLSRIPHSLLARWSATMSISLHAQSHITAAMAMSMSKRIRPSMSGNQKF